MLVFGRNPNYPNVLTKVSALETQISSVTVEKNLKAINSAREAFIQSEYSEKIRRASSTRLEAAVTIFFYEKNNNPRWKGPGCVIGQENKNILVKHGGELVRVHPASLIHVHKANPTTSMAHKTISFEEELQETTQKKELQEIEQIELPENDDTEHGIPCTEEDDEVQGQYDVQEPHITQTEAPNSNEENDPASNLLKETI